MFTWQELLHRILDHVWWPEPEESWPAMHAMGLLMRS